jgi:hypothetical protein
MKKRLALSILMLFSSRLVLADRGPIVWQEGVILSQQSQKAIILHNRSEEILILGTELKSNKETDILEFIPFPSEPKVSAAAGNPFGEAARIIGRKGLVFEHSRSNPVKGKRREEPETTPVEIRFSEKIGLHDVTSIRINDIAHFSGWLREFFSAKGIPFDQEKLDKVFDNAKDYLQRGYSYFVFDGVKVSEKTHFLEPLIYRFKSDRIYYPLKTSNLIGGSGTVELILILPGSISDELWQTTRSIFTAGGDRRVDLSSSAKIFPAEVAAIYNLAPFFNESRAYVQVLKYSGSYDYKNDFTFELNKLIPYPYRFVTSSPFPEERFTPPLTSEEKRDLREEFCSLENAGVLYPFSPAELDCWSFIPSEEYRVFEALFKDDRLSGIPSGFPLGEVLIENRTAREEYRGNKKAVDPQIVKSFNDINRVEYPLENAFLQSDGSKIRVKGNPGPNSFEAEGKTYVSRAGFNRDRTKALVYLEYIANPRSGVGYFVTLEKQNGAWSISDFELGKKY